MQSRINLIVFFVVTTKLVFAQCTVPHKDFFVTNENGTIYKVESSYSEDTAYFAGSFNLIAKYTGNVCKLDKNDPSFSVPMPIVVGNVYEIIADGVGGWFISGSFNKVGSQIRNNICRVDSNGNLLPFNVNVNGAVKTIKVVDSKIYIGGEFNSVNNTIRNNIACIDTSGTLLTWNPDINGMVNKITTYNNKIIAGGSFSSVGGFAISGLVRIDSITAIPDTWANINGTIKDFVIDDSLLYIGGGFSTVGAITREYIAAIRLTDGSVYAPFNVVVSSNFSSVVNSIDIKDNLLYLGGAFTSINGSTRLKLAAVNKLTGVLSTFSKSLNANVNYIKIIDNNIYVSQEAYVNLDKFYLIKINISNSVTENWDPGFTANVNVVISNGNTLLIGGAFQGYHAVKRENLAAVKLSTLQILPWSPVIKSTITAMHFINNKIIVAGYFDSINGIARHHLGMIDINGQVLNWNPNPYGTINDITSFKGIVYVGGNFSQIGGLTRTDFAVLSESLGNVLSFNITPTGSINKVLIYDSTLYILGEFYKINNINKRQIAAFDLRNDPSNPVLKPWAPTTFSNSGTDNIYSVGAKFGKLFITSIKDFRYASFDMIDTSASATSNSLFSYLDGKVQGITFLDSAVLVSYSYMDYALIKKYSPGGESTGNFVLTDNTLDLKKIGNRIFVFDYEGKVANDELDGLISFVDTKPIITSSIPLNQSICRSDTLVFTSSSLTGNMWGVAGNTGISNGQHYVMNDVTTAYVNNRIWVLAPVSDCETALSDGIVFKVLTPPTLSISPSDSTAVCRENSQSISTSSPAVKYLWNTGDTLKQIFGKPGNTYTLTITGSNGCKRTAKRTLTFKAFPAKPVVTSVKGLIVCSTDSTELTSNLSYSYWLHGPSTKSVKVSAGTYGVYLKSSTVGSCMSDTTYITVDSLSLPEKPVISASKNALCGEDTLLLSVNINEADSLRWNTSVLGRNLTVIKSGKYYVTYLNNGCNTMSDTILINNNKSLKPLISANKSTVLCHGDSVILTSNFAGTNVWNNNVSTKAINVSMPGTYKVVAVIEGCNSDSSDNVNVTVNPVPITPIISLLPDSLSLISDALNGNQWYRNNNLINNATSSIYKPSQNGDYAVIVSNNFGCKSSKSNIITIASTGINDVVGEKAGVFLFPNPTTGFVYVSDMVYAVSVFNAQGQLIENNIKLLDDKIIDLSLYINGLYLIQITDKEGNLFYSKVIKN